jgi:hypothetical protein
MVEDMGVYMTAPTTNGDPPLPKRAGARSMVPTTWLDRTIRLEYVGPDGKGKETTATLLDWSPVGLLLSIAGGKTLLAWERLVLADGFYEWQKTANGKQPYYIRMEDGSPFAFAGLWESWKNGSEIRSTTIITTDANDVVAPIHNRMPVTLHPEDYELWLDPDFDEKEPLTTLLEPYPAEAMEAYPVSRRVNSPSNNEPSIIESVA